MRPIVRSTSSKLCLLIAALFGVAASACEAGGVGDPCIPEDEYSQDFPGYSVTEVNVESSSFQCETRVCLAAYFNGRVSCPYGQSGGVTPGSDTGCKVPGTSDPVIPDVQAQLKERQRDDAVYCSCRCDGPDKGARYCECPSGFACRPLVPESFVEGASAQLSGSYCVKDGTFIKDPNSEIDKTQCSGTVKNCGKDFQVDF